jgi:hypothetical protein
MIDAGQCRPRAKFFRKRLAKKNPQARNGTSILNKGTCMIITPPIHITKYLSMEWGIGVA